MPADHASRKPHDVPVFHATGRPVCAPYPADVRFELFEFWPSDMLKLFREAGMPRRVPPGLPGCVADDPSEAPRIASPLGHVSYTLRSSKVESIALEAAVAGDVQQVFWFDGAALVGTGLAHDGALAWRPSTAGVHVIRVVDDHGRAAERGVDVELIK